jgi:hypothetical protein
MEPNLALLNKYRVVDAKTRHVKLIQIKLGKIILEKVEKAVDHILTDCRILNIKYIRVFIWKLKSQSLTIKYVCT